MVDDATKELLERDAEGEERSAGVADYFAVLADGEGDDEAAERVRAEAVVLRNWAALNRTVATLDRVVEEPE